MVRVEEVTRQNPSATKEGMLPMIDAETQTDLKGRLQKIEGQVRGLGRMVEEPRLCIEILTQLAAAQSALKRCSEVVVRYHLTGCLNQTLTKGRSSEIQRRMNELLEIFNRFVS
jgi:DNA-binding FrmR family transcriptional regulator